MCVRPGWFSKPVLWTPQTNDQPEPLPPASELQSSVIFWLDWTLTCPEDHQQQLRKNGVQMFSFSETNVSGIIIPNTGGWWGKPETQYGRHNGVYTSETSWGKCFCFFTSMLLYRWGRTYFRRGFITCSSKTRPEDQHRFPVLAWWPMPGFIVGLGLWWIPDF